MIAADDPARQEAVAWARSAVDQAVQLFIEQGVLDSAVLEARPSWGIPPGILIAMLREKGDRHHSFWLICGADVPFDYVVSSVATSAREAARHFAMKWHLQAARTGESASVQENADRDSSFDQGGAGARLENQAESLFRLVNDDALWRQGWSPG